MSSCYYRINDIIKGMVILQLFQVLQDYSYSVQPYENSFRFSILHQGGFVMKQILFDHDLLVFKKGVLYCLKKWQY
jgi:hypothetical protein